MRGFNTRAVHAAEDPLEEAHGDVAPPIHPTVTHAKRSVMEAGLGYVYARAGNPTREKLERKLASLENARYALAFSSGMAAESAVVLALLRPGSHIVAFDDLYGGTRRLFEAVMGAYGVRVSYVDARDPGRVRGAMTRDTRLIWIETPTNPLMKIASIREIAEIAEDSGAILVVDNTFATPYFQNPLDHGAHIVVHSLTKYISGHSDVLGGALMLNDGELYEKLRFHQKSVGSVLSPLDSWLVLRGVKTLGLRMERHERNAMKIAEYLESRREVERVYYPGLKSHPQHELARRQMRGFSGMLSFEVRGGVRAAIKLVESLKVFSLAESLGGVESLVEIPALMTHSYIPRSERERIGLKDNLVRMSVGIEDVEDLLEDLEGAFKALSGP